MTIFRYLTNLRRRKNLGFGAHTVIAKQRSWRPRSRRHIDPATIIAIAVILICILINLLVFRSLS